MNILVTAGNSHTPIDRVRCLTNIFTGRTGAKLANAAADRGHQVTLFTSHLETAEPTHRLGVKAYFTFEELRELMAGAIRSGQFDALVHAAAVSDFIHAGTYVAAAGTLFDPSSLTWHSSAEPQMLDVSAGKVKSHHPELWLRMTPSPKLIDLVREPWGFRGVLVKFKLEVGLSREALLEVAEKSRLQSRADLMVANTLEGRHDEAFIGAGEYQRVPRGDLSVELLNRIESLVAKGKSEFA